MTDYSETPERTLAAAEAAERASLDPHPLIERIAPQSRTLRCLYDLRQAPVTFDFCGFLAAADCARQLMGLDALDITIRAGEYRDRTARDKETVEDEKIWRTHNILLDCCQLLPTLASMTLTHEDRGPYDFPAGECRAPYLTADILRLWKKGADPRVFKAPGHAKALVKQQRGDAPYATLTLRTSAHQPQRNSDLAEWAKFHDWLLKDGYRAVVVPDQEDVTRGGEYLKHFPHVEVAGAFSLGYRMALYEGAAMNLGSTNGPLTLTTLGHAPVIQFDQLKGNVFTPRHYCTLFGFSPPKQFPWSAPDQRLAWVDSSFDNLKAEFERMMAKRKAA